MATILSPAEVAIAVLDQRRRERLALPLCELPTRLPRGLGGIVVDRDPLPLYHLAPIADPLERAFAGERIRFCGSASVQHGKSALLHFGIGRALARNPRLRIGYASYASAFAVDQSKKIRDVALYLGVELRSDVQSGSLWRTTSGGLLTASGVDGHWVGKSLDVAVVDDPYRSRDQAESPIYRAKVETMVRSLLDRSKAVVIIHARWHPEDAIGAREGDADWNHANLAALCEDPASDPLRRAEGEALWPAVKSREFFAEAQKNAYDWASLYQGRPRPRGGKVFDRLPLYYSQLPTGPCTVAIGWDFAYSRGKASDRSVVVVMAVYGDTFYVLDVQRWQDSITTARAKLYEVFRHYPGAVRLGMIGGQERGIVELLNEPKGDEPGMGLTTLSASGRGDKYVRAQAVSVAWNDGKVLLPSAPHPHMGEFVRVLGKFTGVSDAEDDDVDALVNAHHSLKRYVGRESVLDGPRIRVWRR